MIFGIGRGIFCVGVAVILSGTARAADPAEPTATTRDALVYKDGDRLQGKLVQRTADEIVFHSDRFGVLRVPTKDAVVILAEKPSELTAPPTSPIAPNVVQMEKAEPKRAAERAEEERVTLWERFSPWQLTAKVKNFFGPWHGRFAFATEVVTDTAHRSDYSLDGHLQRKWEHDEVELNGRYDYAVANQLKTTDTLRGSASGRHDFNKRVFAQYRPTLEWNRAGLRNGAHNEYVLMQQEIGAGFSFVARPGRKLRAGISENLFDVWNSAPTPDHTSRANQSLFEEAEWTLPWRMTLTQRGVWYPIPNKPDSWEDRVELNKKLTETLSIAVRHEMRRDSPDGSASDYTRLKLLFGFDF